MIRESHVLQFWWWCIKFPCAREFSSLFARVWSFCPSFLAARLTFSCRYTWEFHLRSLSWNYHSFLVLSQRFFLRRPTPYWLEIPNFVVRHPLYTYCALPDWWVWLLPREACHSRSCLVLASTRHQTQCALWLESENFWNGCWKNVEKLMILKKHRKWFHSFLEKLSFGQDVSELVFGVNKFDLDFGFQVDSVKQPIKSNSVSSWHMSHCRTSSLYDHLDHCFVVFKHIQQSILMRRVDVWGNKINIVQIIDHSLRLFSFLNCVRCWTSFTFVHNGSHRSIMVLSCVSKNCDDQIPWIKWGDTIQPTLHIGSMFCFFPANFMSSTYTDKNKPFPRCTKRQSQFGIFSQPCLSRIFSNCLPHSSPAKEWPYRFRSSWSPQGRQQSLSLETNPVCNAVTCFPHDNIDDGHSCDEFWKSALRIVCHMPESILWLILQACWLSTRCQVVQFLTNTSISRQFATMFLTILQLIQVPPIWIDDHSNKDAKLCKVALLSCSPIRSIVQRIFWACPFIS